MAETKHKSNDARLTLRAAMLFAALVLIGYTFSTFTDRETDIASLIPVGFAVLGATCIFPWQIASTLEEKDSASLKNGLRKAGTLMTIGVLALLSAALLKHASFTNGNTPAPDEVALALISLSSYFVAVLAAVIGTAMYSGGFIMLFDGLWHRFIDE